MTQRRSQNFHTNKASAAQKLSSKKLIAKPLLKWFDAHGRKDLPWQKNKTAYRVWVSEIMLQQTQVKTVIPYYQRFMRSFPSVQKLAQAPLDEVLHHWSGLGYYARARNLHKSAVIVHEQFNNRFPQSVDELVELPGIGRSTAGAICAVVFEQSTSILDGNVKRVLCRYHGVQGWPGKADILNKLWHLAEQQTPKQRCADYTQAIMDLGATVCTRSKAKCDQCPLEKNCVALAENLVSTLPTSKPRKVLPEKHCQMLLIEHDNQILLEQRPAQGLWGGLWAFPEIASDQSLADWCATRFPNKVKDITQLGKLKHSFSHYHLHIQAAHIRLQQKPAMIRETQTQLWYDLQQPQNIGTAAVVTKLLKRLAQHKLV